MDRRLYWIWLQRHLPLGSPAVNRLFDAFEDIEDIYAADVNALRDSGLRPPECLRLADKSLADAKRILQSMRGGGGWILTPEDACYPDLLRHIEGFPPAVYGEGVLPDMNRLPAMAVVGTRHPSDDGRDAAYAFAGGLAAAGMVIVSGGAVGIDAAAHEGALEAGGRTVLIKAAPPEISYPVQNAALRDRILHEGGAILTEFAPGFPFRCDYHVRNRLMAGMSVGVCVAEAPQRSGALITANLAREQGRDVFAIPGSVKAHTNDGAHRQIRKGAMLVTSAADVLEEYALRFPGMLDCEAAKAAETRLTRSKPLIVFSPRRQSPVLKVADATPAVFTLPDGISEPAKQLLSHMGTAPCPIDLLAKNAGMSVPDTLVLLTELEILGCVKSTAGQQYCRK